MDVAANNLANVSTAGFKADVLSTRSEAQNPARSEDRPTDIRFVRDVIVAHDFAPGPIRQTGEPFDLAIEGGGFFTVQGPQGAMYTRNGAFQINGQGQLVTAEGYPVLNTGGAPIVLDPQGAPPTIDATGSVRINGVEAGQLGLASFANPLALEKAGDNLWLAPDQAAGAFTGKIAQGALESSNVNAVVELTRLIEISRAYESAARIVRGGDDLRRSALERLGRG
jgi:flagellar basal-body rod protein FlgF